MIIIIIKLQICGKRFCEIIVTRTFFAQQSREKQGISAGQSDIARRTALKTEQTLTLHGLPDVLFLLLLTLVLVHVLLLMAGQGEHLADPGKPARRRLRGEIKRMLCEA